MNNPFYKNNFGILMNKLEIMKKKINILVPDFSKNLSRNFKDKKPLT